MLSCCATRFDLLRMQVDWRGYPDADAALTEAMVLDVADAFWIELVINVLLSAQIVAPRPRLASEEEFARAKGC